MAKAKTLKEIKADYPELKVVTKSTPPAPQLRWLTVKQPNFFKKGEMVLQYFGDNKWIDVPQVEVE